MRLLNPKNSQDLDDLYIQEDDMESGQISSTQYTRSGLEIELSSAVQALQRNLEIARKEGGKLSWFQLIFGSSTYA